MALAVVCLLFLPAFTSAQGLPDPTELGGTCTRNNVPIKCAPREQNVIFDPIPPATFTASSVCNGDTYCIRSDPSRADSSIVCTTCPAPNEDHNSPIGFGRANLYNLNEEGTSLANIRTTTRWQSRTLASLSENVVLQANMALPFLLDSITILFYSVKPAALFVEKSRDFGQTWIRIVYFARDCQGTYNIPPRLSPQAPQPSFPNNTDVVECIQFGITGTGFYLDNTPEALGSSVQYRFQQNRVSNTEFTGAQTEVDIESTPALEQFLTATNVRVVLDEAQYPAGVAADNRWNYYSAYDMNIRAGCICNGHAGGECRPNGNCTCEHRTTGPDCSVCLPGYVDVPWRKATLLNPFQCEACNCNNHADIVNCVFSQSRYLATNNTSGGVCQGCRDNTAGPQCESCIVAFYPNPASQRDQPNSCIACGCDARGITDDTVGDCSKTGPVLGQCNCKSLVTGRQCDTCMPNSFGLAGTKPTGCTPCGCVAAGTVGNAGACETSNGQCDCKGNVEGRTCGQCKTGFFDLQASNVAGCQPCDCYLGGATAVDACDRGSGQCNCRRGFTGRRCNIIINNFYLPNFYGIRFEAENQVLTGQIGATLSLRSTIDLINPFTGRGYVNLNYVSGTGIFIFSNFPAALLVSGHQYCLYIRYRLPATPTSVTVQIDASRNIAFSVIGSAGPVSLNLNTGCNVVRLGTVAPNCPTGVCPSTAALALRFTTNPANTDLLIDSISLRPQPNLITEFASAPTGGLTQFAQAGCATSCPLSPTCTLSAPTGTCQSLQISAMAGLFQGALACGCSSNSVNSTCDPSGGQCFCRTNVVGRTCTQCRPTTFNLGITGCQDCGCDAVGSAHSICNPIGGQCVCKAGRTGRTCNQCLQNFYPDPANTGMCLACNCDPVGSTSQQCNQTGHCPCIPNVQGLRCDACGCNVRNTINGDTTCSQPIGQCNCKTGSTGLKCETCTNGYFLDAVQSCQVCNCNNHASSCSISGCVDCQHNTVGQTCQQCAAGFFGNARGGTVNDCQRCQCNGWSNTCVVESSDSLGHVCTSCTGNTAGPHCNICLPNFFGAPLNHQSACQACLPRCNNNINPLVQNSCDASTGRCLLCVNNAAGQRCEVCAPGFYGDATTQTCQSCNCNSVGSNSTVCNPSTGQCPCHPNIVGRQCSACAANHYDFESGTGCSPCACDPVGSTSQTCLLVGGQCPCRAGIQSRSCSNCAAGTFGFSAGGCQPCACNLAGTLGGSNVCDPGTGQCPCEPQTIRRQCDACAAGFYFVPTQGCTACPCNNRADTCTSSGICINCNNNFEGDQCERCSDGFYFLNNLCVPCNCHTQGSTSTICNKQNGQCTCRAGVDQASRTCSICSDGFHSLSSTGCVACTCFNTGSTSTVCRKSDGQCTCRAGFTGRDCNQCQDGFYSTNLGCPACACHSTGSTSQICDKSSGQCTCRNNVIGRQCATCAPNTFGLSVTGCQLCACSLVGSTNSQCDQTTGHCTCKAGVGNNGRAREQCTICQDGFFNYGNSGCTPCGCHATGSITQTCAKDATGQCPCHVNLIDRTCRTCRDGHVIEADGTGCVQCPCNVLGSVSTDCSRANGSCSVVCTCKANVGGCNCDRCDRTANIGGFPTCNPCECNPLGSVDGSCDTSGQCVCKTGALGQKCNSCAENFFLSAQGCEECPTCYGEVRDQVVSVRVLLARLRELLNTLLRGSLLNSVPPVISRLNTLLAQACALLDDVLRAVNNDPVIEQRIASLAPTVQQVINEIRNAISRLRIVQEAISSANGGVRTSEEQIRASRILSQAGVDNLDIIMGHLATGSTGVTELARLRQQLDQEVGTAEAKALQLNATAQIIRSYAYNASETAGRARTVAIRALMSARTTSETLLQLSPQVLGSADFVANATEALNAATAANMKATAELATATAVLAAINLELHSQRNMNASRHASALHTSVQQIVDSNAHLNTYVERNASEAGQLVEDEEEARNRTIALKGRARTAYDRAAAVRDATRNSQAAFANRLEILRNFSDETAMVREAASRALNSSAQLSQRSTEEEQRATELIEAHNSSLANSSIAAATSNSALELSINATQFAHSLRSSANGTEYNQQRVLSTVETIHSQVGGVRTILNTTVTTCNRHHATARSNYREARSEHEKAANLTVTADQYTSEGLSLQAELDGISSLSTTRLQEIHTELQALQGRLSATDVSALYGILNASLTRQRTVLNGYLQTITELSTTIIELRTQRDVIASTCPS